MQARSICLKAHYIVQTAPVAIYGTTVFGIVDIYSVHQHFGILVVVAAETETSLTESVACGIYIYILRRLQQG